jgi:hypothetical protein
MAKANGLPKRVLAGWLGCVMLAACGGDKASSDAGAQTADSGGGTRAAAGSGGAGAGNPAGAASSAGTGDSGGAKPMAGRTGSGGNAAGSGGKAGSGVAGTAGASGRASAMDAMVTPNDAGTPEDAASATDSGANAMCGKCAAYAAPMQTGTVDVSGLDALSGLAASRAQSDIVFVHNDHDRPVVYAIDLEGRLHARITLEGAMATDIEDIAVGPCGDQTCVFLGDIGDNGATRGEYAVLRFTQPSVPASPGSTAMTATFERYRFTYEDGSHNAESLMVAPDGNLYIVSKLAPGSGGKVTASGVSSVYKLAASSLSASAVARATKVATLTIPMTGDLAASAAAAHPCGQGFLVRTYNRVYEFVTPAGAGFESAFQATPTVVAMPDEPQSEGIDYRSDGRGFISSGEGSKAPVMLTACKP